MNKLNESNWRDINWASSNDNVRKWQHKIYSASKVGEVKEVRRCQHAILGLMDSKLIAVRQITQDNKGRKTPGVDKALYLQSKGSNLLGPYVSIPPGVHFFVFGFPNRAQMKRGH